MKSKKENKLIKGLSLLGWIIFFIFKTATIDLARNLKKAHVYAFNKEEKDKINREAVGITKAKTIIERIERTERLIYSVFRDPRYYDSFKGKEDLYALKKEIK